MSQARPNTLRYVLDPGPMEFSAQEQEILERVNQKIAGAPSLEETMDFLFEMTKEICHCDRVSVAFVEDDAERIVSRYATASYEPLLLDKGYVGELAGSSLETVIRLGRCRLIGDLADYAADHPNSHATQKLLQEGVRSSMTCPLKVGGRTVGLLFRSSKVPNTFTDHEVAIHVAITERLSQALEKAYRIDQLAAANAAYMEMLSFVTHELKSPLASIVMTAELLRDGSFGALNEAQCEKIDRMVYKGEYLLTLIRDYLNLARMEGGEMTLNLLDSVPFTERVVAPSIEMVQPWLTGKEMTLETDLSSPAGGVPCDPDLMTIVMTNLLSNAAKYGCHGGKIKLTITTEDDGLEGLGGLGRNLHVSVWNEGPGFAKADRANLFRKFSRLADPALRKAKGTGVGLYTVWRILNLHGGKIEATSKQGEYALFEFCLPLNAKK